ncbi:hypothetical protein [Mesorhizobium loti]|uniref:hypothetical protein n=1 Tax=Rhizobium loti TaxID=381 RepID=UPI0009E642DE|nr:hypothetical protein [Mesorhizobium loti]
MELRLNIEGATPEELARGVAAALAGITALQGAKALFALEGCDIRGFPQDDQPTEDEDQATPGKPLRDRLPARPANYQHS